MSEKLPQTGELTEVQVSTSFLQSLRGKFNLKASLIAGAIGAVLTSCEPDKEMASTPNEAPELGVSVKSVSTTNFVLNLDYKDDKEGGTIDYIIKDKTTGVQIGDGQVSVDKKTLYIGGLQPEQSYQANLEAIDSDGKETPKSIDVTTSVVEQPAAPTLNTNILNILENSTEHVQVLITSEQDIEEVTITGETSDFLDLQSVEQIAETNDYTITLKPHDLNWETSISYLGGLNVETSLGTTELTLNIGVLNENEATPILFGEEENKRGTEGEYFVFKWEDSALRQFYTHGEELMNENEVLAVINNPVLTGTMSSMLTSLQLFEYMPMHTTGVPYIRTELSNIIFQDANGETLKVMSHSLFKEQFAYMKDRILSEDIEGFSDTDGSTSMTYFSNPLAGAGVVPTFTEDWINKVYSDWAIKTEAETIDPKFITKFVVEKKLYNLSVTE